MRIFRVSSLASIHLVLPLLLATAAAGGGCGEENRPARWGYLSPAIFQPTCATVSCHSRATAVAGLDFSAPERGYRSLTGLSVTVPNASTGELEVHPRPLVTPYNPQQSRVVNMLRARNAPRMPPERPLGEADIQLVERWILDGAREADDAPD